MLTKGLGAVTLSAVAREAGENKAMTAYYFGNKAGLISAVMDSVVHDEYVRSMSRLENVRPEQLADAIVDEMRLLHAFKNEWRISFELYPYALREAPLRDRLRQLYQWYYEVKCGWFETWAESVDDETVQGLTELLAAVIDGLAIQDVLNREGFDIDRPYRVFARMLRLALENFSSTEQAQLSGENAELGVSAGQVEL